MTYERFAYVYDFLMEDVPYEQWVHFFERHVQTKKNTKVLDVACGTGEFTIRLAEAGWDVTGVDLSEEMLMMAHQKASEKGINLPLFQQDMSRMDALGEYEAVTIFCDSLNYLQTEEAVQQTFGGVYRHLKQGGLFLFDVHSLYKMRNIFKNGTFTSVDEEISYIWNCFDGEEADSIEHELTFFALDEESGLYQRFDELHRQRTFTQEAYSQWLKDAGFEVVQISADYEDTSPQQKSERVFFVAKKV